MKQYIANISFDQFSAFYNTVSLLHPDPKYIPLLKGYVDDDTVDFKITVSDEDLLMLKLKFAPLIIVQVQYADPNYPDYPGYI
jgi:hypothetical protein